jgi:hypothetical protein
MPHHIKYTQKEQFINRTKELDFLAQWINRKPQHILFIYLRIERSCANEYTGI